MAIMLPDLTESQLSQVQSEAEVKVYRALRDHLPIEFVVFFQVDWILRREDEEARDGEIDFLVAHPGFGYLTIEVKGGGIGFDALNGCWFSIDRKSERHLITNPIGQALRAKYSIRNKLNEHPYWRSLKLQNTLRGHTVFFPDLNDVASLGRPDMPATLIGSARDLSDPKPWIERVFKYWGGQASNWTPLESKGISLLRDVFARSFSVMPLISSRLAAQENLRLKLTQDQIRVLDLLRARRRVAVSGGAGTGKTVLAVEKARRLSKEGFRTLLTCYNRPLADHLASVCEDIAGLEVMSFHQLCYKMVEIANRTSGRDLVAEARVTYPGKGLFEVQLPNALTYALDVLPDRYDAIVCDEGQDFVDEFWLPLEMLLADYEESPFYVFYDDNQNLYHRSGAFPIRDEPFALTVNCRNTAPIHEAAYRYYKGEPVIAPELDGDHVQYDEAYSREHQATKIHMRIVDLLTKEKVSPYDIVVLIADAPNKTGYYSALKGHPLPRIATWKDEGVRSSSTVLIDTVQRFKGLEAAVVILWGIDAIDLKQNDELFYVGDSRAKSLLVLVGRPETITSLRQPI